MMIKISVVIPAYITSEKGRDDLMRLVSKIVEQIRRETGRCREWRVIIIDDGSPQRLEAGDFPDDKAQLIKIQHSGVARARNVGIEASRPWADYLFFVDADDDVPESFILAIDEEVALLKICQPDIIQFNARYEDGSVGFPEPCAWGKLISIEWIGDDRFDEDQFIGEEDTLFKKEGKEARILRSTQIAYLHRQSANPDSLMKRFWRGEIPRRRGEECYHGDLARSAKLTCEEDS